MNPWLVGGSVAATLALAGGGWLTWRRRDVGRIESPEQAAAIAAEGLSGFVPHNAVVGTDWRGALVVATDGRVAVVKTRGRTLAVREVPWHAVVATYDGIVVETGERRFGRVPVVGVDSLDVRRLAPAGANWRRR